MIVIEVVEPYSREVLKCFGVEPGTAEEYAFCLGWQDGAEWNIVSVPPVAESHIEFYTKGWALGAWNRMRWLRQGLDQMAKRQHCVEPTGSADE